MKNGEPSNVIKDEVISIISPCLSSSKCWASLFAGFKNLNLNLTGVSLLNCLGVIII